MTTENICEILIVVTGNKRKIKPYRLERTTTIMKYFIITLGKKLLPPKINKAHVCFTAIVI